MATERSFVDHVCDRLAGAGVISARKMFGEYGLYCDGKIVGLICDNQLFLKPLPVAIDLLGEVTLAPPYPGAKGHIVVDEALEDSALMARVVAGLAAALSEPKPKAPRGRK
jgi:TfoX/Sxy family transcriptional regulator of competence genes